MRKSTLLAVLVVIQLFASGPTFACDGPCWRRTGEILGVLGGVMYLYGDVMLNTFAASFSGLAISTNPSEKGLYLASTIGSGVAAGSILFITSGLYTNCDVFCARTTYRGVFLALASLGLAASAVSYGTSERAHEENKNPDSNAEFSRWLSFGGMMANVLPLIFTGYSFYKARQGKKPGLSLSVDRLDLPI